MESRRIRTGYVQCTELPKPCCCCCFCFCFCCCCVPWWIPNYIRPPRPLLGLQLDLTLDHFPPSHLSTGPFFPCPLSPFPILYSLRPLHRPRSTGERVQQIGCDEVPHRDNRHAVTDNRLGWLCPLQPDVTTVIVEHTRSAVRPRPDSISTQSFLPPLRDGRQTGQSMPASGQWNSAAAARRRGPVGAASGRQEVMCSLSMALNSRFPPSAAGTSLHSGAPQEARPTPPDQQSRLPSPHSLKEWMRHFFFRGQRVREMQRKCNRVSTTRTRFSLPRWRSARGDDGPTTIEKRRELHHLPGRIDDQEARHAEANGGESRWHSSTTTAAPLASTGHLRGCMLQADVTRRAWMVCN